MAETRKDSDKDKRRRRRRPPRPRGHRLLRALATTASVAAAAVVIVVVVMNPPWRAADPTAGPTTPFPTIAAAQPSGTIAEPAAGDAVGDDVMARGTVRDVPAGSTLWVITEVIGPDGHPAWEQLKPRLTDRLWPGPQAVSRLANDEWQALVPIGDRPHHITGLQLRISLVVVDEAADAAFRRYNLTAENQRHPGISPIPTSGLTRLDDVVVFIDLPPVIL